MNDLTNFLKHTVRDAIGAQPHTDYAVFVDVLPNGYRVQMLIDLDRYTLKTSCELYHARARIALNQATRYELRGLTLDDAAINDVQYIGDSQHVASLTWYLRSNE